MANKLRIGIIGTGGIAHSHMRAYLKLTDYVEIVAGADLVPGKAKAFFEEFGVQANAYEDHQEMIAKEKLDGVSVCTYNSTHSVCTVNALNAGLHVLTEKPMSVNLQDAVDMVAASKKANKILTVGFQPRYDPNMKMIKEIVSSGILGKVYYVSTGGGRRRGMPGGTFINKEKAGVGCLADIGCYSLDMVLNALGYPNPLTVSAYASNYFGTNPKYHPDAKNFQVDDFSAAFIRLEGDLVIDFKMSWAMHMDTMGATCFLGTDAGLKVNSHNPKSGWGGAWDGTCGDLFLYQDVGKELTETPIPPKVNPEGFNMFDCKIKDFCDAIIENKPAPIPGEQILRNQAIIDGIIRSVAAGKEVEVNIPQV